MRVVFCKSVTNRSHTEEPRGPFLQVAVTGNILWAWPKGGGKRFQLAAYRAEDALWYEPDGRGWPDFWVRET